MTGYSSARYAALAARAFILASLVTLLLAMLLAINAAPAAAALDRQAPSTADHEHFEELQGPFASGPEVTEACLGCHTEAAKQLQATTHWTWEYMHPETRQLLGKRHVVNSFCGSVTSNEPFCTSCHTGYGWDDMRQEPPTADNRVDCLVCHDRFFVVSCGFGLIEQAAYRTANQVDHGDEVGLVPVTPCA